jgi:DNA-binding NarL/FixJ family response regulator
MQAQKSVVVCMSETMYRFGLTGLLKESGYSVCLANKPSELHRETHKRLDYLILGDSNDTYIADGAQSCLGRIEPLAVIVVVKALKLSEVDRLKSLGVHAILSVDIKPADLVQILTLLPEHWIVNMSIAVPDGISSMHLTSREWEILSMLTQGSSVKDIAIMLNLSTKTVDAHKTNLMRKLDIHNRAGLVLWHVANKHLWKKNLNDSL